MSDLEPLVHLGLSHKAAKALAQMIDACHINADGEPMDFVDDDDKYEIAEAIVADIKEQLPAPSKGTKRKKGTKK